MPWIQPKQTLGGKTFWEAVEDSAYFQLQKHITTHVQVTGSILRPMRSLWSSCPVNYRIILKEKPYYCIALANDRDTIDLAWQWIQSTLIQTNYLDYMDKSEVQSFLIYLFSLKAAGKNDTEIHQLLVSKGPQKEKQNHNQQQSTSSSSSSGGYGSFSATPALLSFPEDENEEEEEEEEEGEKERTGKQRQKHQQKEKETGENGEDQLDDKDLCKICLDAPIETVILDCGHSMLCVQCASKYDSSLGCPICRAPIKEIKRLYRC
jgi:hypothetical protein